MISLVEAGGEDAKAVSRLVFPRTGRAWTVGVTGAPGAGKSTLLDALVRCMRAAGERAAVVAVDPSSPFSGGAILGDRTRMQDHAGDSDVFVRSMASRGQLGGLAAATVGAARVLDAAGWGWILIETVGAGQVDIDVGAAADTTLLVLTPGWGDSLQVAKAGVMEAADILVVNKADRPGADEAVRDLELHLDLSAGEDRQWRPPVVRTVAATGEGVGDLWGVLNRHRQSLIDAGGLAERRAQRLASEVRQLVRSGAARAAEDHCEGPEYERIVADVAGRRLDPLTAAEEVLAAVRGWSGR